VAAQVEKAVFDPDLVDAEDLGEQLAQGGGQPP
jgi:hypothetical protein